MSEHLRNWLSRLEQFGELQRVLESVNWDEEMAAITYLYANRKDASALLFENIHGYRPGYRVLFNMLGLSTRRIAISLGLPAGTSIRELPEIIKDKLKQTIPPVTIFADEAPVNENVHLGEEVDLLEFPVPKMWPLDGGRYIGTGDAIITRDPSSGIVNLGTYRQMVLDKKRVAFYVSPGKDALLHREQWWKKGKPCPVAAVYGVDPVMFMVGSQTFPKNLSEYDFLGGLYGEGVRVFISEVTGLPIPAEAEIVVEGFSYPDVIEKEGPFGEFTGYYGRPGGTTPVIDIKCVRHRNNPILTSALMSDYPACEQSMFFSIMRSARVWDDMERLGIPGVKGVYTHPAAASGLGMVVISIQQQYAGHAAQCLAMAAQGPGGAYYNKWIIAVDDDVDPTDMDQVIWAMATRCNPADDIDILRQTWSTYLDPTRNPVELRPYGSKALINACKEHRFISQFARRTSLRKSVYEQVTQRWQELGLPGSPPELSRFQEE